MIYIRKCPECYIELSYKTVSSRNLANRNKSKCYRCAKFGNKNPMFNKKHSNKVKDNQSERMRKNNPSKLQHVRKIFSEKIKGENNPKIKNILKKENITFDDYFKRKSKLQLYRDKVLKITNKQDLKSLKNCNLRGRCGVKGAYQLDHIIPIKYGYLNNISPEELGDISNLRFIPWFENRMKSDTCMEMC